MIMPSVLHRWRDCVGAGPSGPWRDCVGAGRLRPSLWVCEIFGAHVLEPGAYVLARIQLTLDLFTSLFAYRKVSPFASCCQHGIRYIDGGLKPQCQSQRITRACIGNHRKVLLRDVELGII